MSFQSWNYPIGEFMYNKIQMQRSLVNQFKNSSLFQSTVLGTHSVMNRQPLSPRNDTQHSVRRITHLPHDRHHQIKLQTDMVVVFQTIEIERLNSEIELLNAKMREKHDVVINAGSYQVQIRQLTQKCYKIENEKYSYMQELAKTKEMGEIIYNQLTALKSRYEECDFSAVEKYKLEKARNQELSLEIEKWKGRYASLDKAKSQELEAARKTFDLHRDTTLNAGSKQLMTKMQMQREELLSKLRQRKQVLDEKQLELKKMNNFCQQLQVRSKEQDHSIQEYEQKVAMLSQQNYRLSEMVRVKSEQIKNLKMANENDVSFRLSQITGLDETKNRLNEKLRAVQENNDQLREALRTSEQQLTVLKKKAAESDRFEMQARLAKRDIESKLKSMERKDKRIITLQQELKVLTKNQQQLLELKQKNSQLGQQIRTLKKTIQQKIAELRKLREMYLHLKEDYEQKFNHITKRYEKQYLQIQMKYNKVLSSENTYQQKSSALELQARQTALLLKQKDYTISSLKGELKIIQNRLASTQKNQTALIKDLENQIQFQRSRSELNLKEIQSKKKDLQKRLKQEMEFLQNEKQRNAQIHQQKMREVDAKYREIHHQKEQQVLELKHILAELINAQDEFVCKQTDISNQIRYLQSRFDKIEEIIYTLKNSLSQRHRAAVQQEQQLKITQNKYQELQEWFFKFYQKYNQPSQYSPSPKKKTQETMYSPRTRTIYSPEVVPRNSQQSLNTNTSIYGFKYQNEQETSMLSRGCQKQKQIPLQWLLKFVMLCAEVQSLRKRVGDKQAKVESLRNSIASKNTGSSSATLLNGLYSSNSSNQSGFFTSRQSSLNRKGNIYY